MKKFKLVSSLEYGKTLKDKSDTEYRGLRNLYDSLLEMTLTLGMFVPCDEYGNVLEPPNGWAHEIRDELNQYQQAKESILFEGFEIDPVFSDTVVKGDLMINMLEYVTFQNIKTLGITYGGLKTVENLVQFQPTLTESAKKLIGIIE